MVIGSGPIGRFWRQELETGFARFRDRVTVHLVRRAVPSGYPAPLREPSSHSAIVYITFGTDAQGGTYADEQVLADLHATANAPCLERRAHCLGHGIVGGTMLSIDDLGRRTGDVAGRILNGEPPASLRVPPQSAGQPMFDWRELQRWRIPESRLPPGSVVQFRPRACGVNTSAQFWPRSARCCFNRS